MPEYKLQHWLPASYLQFFAVSGTPEGRDSIVYVTTSEKSETRKVKNIAVSNFLYSRLDPKSAEERFHRAEGDYPQFLRKALNGAPLQKSERMQLFMIMLDLHFRNPVYVNETSKERTDAAEHMVRSFLIERVVCSSEAEAQDLDNVVDRVFDRWELQAVEVPQSVQLWTSDHPALLFSLGEARVFAFAIPSVITPKAAINDHQNAAIGVCHQQASCCRECSRIIIIARYATRAL